MMDCIQCGQQIRDGEDTWLVGKGMPAHRDCKSAAIARAEALTAEVERLTADNAALRAQLDAAGWQPVTDDWPPVSNSLPVLMRNGLTRYGYRSGGHWHLTGGKYTADAVTHAFQLPPAPPQE